LTHPDFFALAEAVRARAFALKLFSNGSLIDEALADRLAALRPMAVEMSLHGAGAEVHDATTGRPGSFDALWAAVELLERRRVPILLKTPLTRLNEHQLETMVAQVKGRGLSHSVDPTLTPNDTGDPAPLAYAASPAGVERLMRVLLAHDRLPLARRTEGGSNCGLGRMTLAVDPEGNVYPCLQWRQTSLGNVRGTRLRELWRAAPERQEAADVARAANDALLRRGGAAATFPYCPALAFQRSGDPLTPDPAFLANSAIAERVRQAAGRAGGRASQ
jgi:MoaA/NifB/PqqE/SkfB family radical SAM enzyme